MVHFHDVLEHSFPLNMDFLRDLDKELCQLRTWLAREESIRIGLQGYQIDP
jgi:hypothetical protein